MSICNLVSEPELLDRFVLKFNTEDFHYKLSDNSDFQLYGSIKMSSFHKTINRLSFYPIKFHRFCW
jgi:hypothetical protein